MFTQLAKMLVLATFFPDNVSDFGNDLIGVSKKHYYIDKLKLVILF